jgi:hypothetical protein
MKSTSIFIVSHKSRFSAKNKKDLIEPATIWIENVIRRDLGAIKIPFFFEKTREAKIQKIKDLKLTHFVDDLPEIFVDDLFPKHLKSFLLCDESSLEMPRSVIRVGNCREILEHV